MEKTKYGYVMDKRVNYREVIKKELDMLQFNNLKKSGYDAVVVLSAEEVRVDGENGQRIDVAIKYLLSSRSHSPLIFLGTVEHIKNLEAYIQEMNYKITILFPSRRKYESTWTQIKSLVKFLERHSFDNLLIISHTYHIPRISRYCKKYIKNASYDFYPVGRPVDQEDKIEEEIDKIFRYAEKGDLPLLI